MNKIDVIADYLEDYLPGVIVNDVACEIIQRLADNGYSIVLYTSPHRPIDDLAATHDSPEYACGMDA
jgi:hypothetical protein